MQFIRKLDKSISQSCSFSWQVVATAKTELANPGEGRVLANLRRFFAVLGGIALLSPTAG
jgi:hypothetical protein